MIQESYVTFEQAKVLKKSGFHQYTNLYYGLFYDMSNIEDWMEIPINDSYEFSVRDNCEEYYACPTFSLVQKWLREEKNLHIETECRTIVNHCLELIGSYYLCNVLVFMNQKCNTVHIDTDYDTYEQALSVGIDKCISILKQHEFNKQ